MKQAQASWPRPWQTPWIVRFGSVQVREPELRLFCFPYAGGGASSFRDWADLLPPEVELCAVQPPGREGRLKEAPLRELGVVLEAIAAETAPLRDRPFIFLGHSLGALVAFELTRLLRRQRERLPLHLFVSGCGAPQLRDREPALAALDDAELAFRLRRYRGTPDAVFESAEILELVLPTLRADFALRDNYVFRPQPPLDLPITAFGGEDDADVDPAALEAWRELTRGSFQIQRFAGGHFFLRPAKRELVETVVSHLSLGAGRTVGDVARAEEARDAV